MIYIDFGKDRLHRIGKLARRIVPVDPLESARGHAISVGAFNEASDHPSEFVKVVRRKKASGVARYLAKNRNVGRDHRDPKRQRFDDRKPKSFSL
jgi:hypothetical protein